MDDQRRESLAWDRFGRFLQQSASVSSEAAERNLQLWSSVASHLKSESYRADEMADDVALSVSTAMSNVSALWSLFTTESAQNAIARPVPTAFLLFDWAGTSGHRLLEPVRIELGPAVTEKRSLPDRARIQLSGSRYPRSEAEKDQPCETSEDGIRRLLGRLVAYWDKDSNSYILADVNRILEKPTSGKVAGEGWAVDEPLVPGVYDGVVYLTDPPELLASVRILVEGKPPDPPVVSEDPPPSELPGRLA